MIDSVHILPLGAVIFCIGVIWGAGIVIGSIRTRLEQHAEELKKIGEHVDDGRKDMTEVKRCIAKIEGALKVTCNGR